METQCAQLPESKVFVQTTEQWQHSLCATTAITHPIKETETGVRAGFLRIAHRAGREHGQTSVWLKERGTHHLKTLNQL